MKVPADLYTRSPRVFRGLNELTYPFHDTKMTVTLWADLFQGPHGQSQPSHPGARTPARRALGGHGRSDHGWTAQQFREAFPGDEVPRYLIRDRDSAFVGVGPTATGMGIHEVLTAPRSPLQNAYAERLIGSIRRECIDHVIVVNEIGLSRILTRYVAYYHESRTHLSLAKDSPQPRSIAGPTIGQVVAIPQVGGLHHRYDRRAA
jgi:hypothetical protein